MPKAASKRTATKKEKERPAAPLSHLAQAPIQEAWQAFMGVVKANYPDMRDDQGLQLLEEADWFALKAVAELVEPLAAGVLEPGTWIIRGPGPHDDDPEELAAIDRQRRPPW